MFIQRPNAHLHTLSFGQGPLTLLTIGGWVAGGDIWHEAFGHLPNWRCVSLDHRGAGHSTHNGPITVSDMADDLLAVADALNVGPCVIASESSGAAAALLAIQRAPDRFVGQVLVGASWERVQAGAYDNFFASLRSDYTATLRSFIDNCLPETNSAELRHWGLQTMTRSSVDDAIDLIKSREHIAPYQLRLSCTSYQVLLIHGDQDRIVPVQSSRLLAACLPNAKLHVLPGLGHVPIVTAPAEVAALIASFGQPQHSKLTSEHTMPRWRSTCPARASLGLPGPDGSAPPFYRLFEAWFDSPEHLSAVTGSSAWQKVVADVPKFATGGVTILLSQV